ncbi:hypothetical protein D3C72_2171270 [compost metagenome]
MKATESLPMAALQKLIDGSSTITTASLRRNRLLSCVTVRSTASNASRPIVPKMLKTKNTPTYEKPR